MLYVPFAGLSGAAGVYFAMFAVAQMLTTSALESFLILWSIYSFVGFLTEGVALGQINSNKTPRVNSKSLISAVVVSLLSIALFTFCLVYFQQQPLSVPSFILMPSYIMWLLIQRRLLGNFLAQSRNKLVAASILIDGVIKLASLVILDDARITSLIFFLSAFCGAVFLMLFHTPESDRFTNPLNSQHDLRDFVLPIASQTILAAMTVGTPALMAVWSAMTSVKLTANLLSLIVIDRAIILFICFVSAASYMQLLKSGKISAGWRTFLLVFAVSNAVSGVLFVSRFILDPSNALNLLSWGVIGIYVSTSFLVVSMFVGYSILARGHERKFLSYWLSYFVAFLVSFASSSSLFAIDWMLFLGQFAGFVVTIFLFMRTEQSDKLS